MVMLWVEKRAIYRQRGFSLIELLIAISLLAVGLLAAISMQSTAMNSNMLANRNTAATAVAQQVMEDLLSVNISTGNSWFNTFTIAGTYVYDRFPPYNGTNAPVNSLYSQGSGTFTAQYIITPNTPAVNISELQVRLLLNGNPVPFRFFGHKSIPM